MNEEVIRKLKKIHLDLQYVVHNNDPDARDVSASEVAATLMEVLSAVGAFCNTCSGTGETWRGTCPTCHGVPHAAE